MKKLYTKMVLSTMACWARNGYTVRRWAKWLPTPTAEQQRWAIELALHLGSPYDVVQALKELPNDQDVIKVISIREYMEDYHNL